MKESVSLRLSTDTLKWLERNGLKWSQQLRLDLRTLKLIEDFLTGGMGGQPLSKMMQLARNNIE